MFRTVPLSIIRSFSLYTQQWYMSYRFADSLWAGSGWNWFGSENQDQDGTGLVLRTKPIPSWSYSQAVSKPVGHIPLLCVQWKTPEDRTGLVLRTRMRTELIWFWELNQFCPDPASKLSANLYDINPCCVYSEKLLMMDRGTVWNM